MSGRPGAKKCDSCGGMKRVLSVSVSITHGLHSVRVPVLHLCEECIINAPDLAKIAHEIEFHQRQMMPISGRACSCWTQAARLLISTLSDDADGEVGQRVRSQTE